MSKNFNYDIHLMRCCCFTKLILTFIPISIQIMIPQHSIHISFLFGTKIINSEVHCKILFMVFLTVTYCSLYVFILWGKKCLDRRNFSYKIALKCCYLTKLYLTFIFKMIPQYSFHNSFLFGSSVIYSKILFILFIWVIYCLLNVFKFWEK